MADVSGHGMTVAQTATALLDAIRGLWPGNLTSDDVTLLLFRPNGLARRVPLMNRQAAPLRVAKGVLGSLRARDAAAPWPELSLANIGGALFSPLSRLWRGRRNRS